MCFPEELVVKLAFRTSEFVGSGASPFKRHCRSARLVIALKKQYHVWSGLLSGCNEDGGP
jgi:hypothetical protein